MVRTLFNTTSDSRESTVADFKKTEKSSLKLIQKLDKNTSRLIISITQGNDMETRLLKLKCKIVGFKL